MIMDPVNTITNTRRKDFCPAAVPNLDDSISVINSDSGVLSPRTFAGGQC
jgi:hypothetical protein